MSLSKKLKQRACSECGTMFPPFDSLSKQCSLRCALNAAAANEYAETAAILREKRLAAEKAKLDADVITVAVKRPAKFGRTKIKADPAHVVRHRRAVAALPCAECGIEGYSQSAHSNRAEDGKGLGIKADYLAQFPLCASRPGVVGCHEKHDLCIGITREEADERTTRYIAETKAKLGAA